MQIVDILQLLIPNVWTAVTQLCATAILFFLMYKLAWKPVKKILDERSLYEQKKLSDAEALRAQNEEIAAQAEQIIADANQSAEQILSDAREEGNSLKKELIEEGKKESAQLLENAQRDMEIQKNRMKAEIHSEMVDAALSAASKMLQTKLDDQADRDNIDSFIREVTDK
ncbi:MAG: F0F1 ATP synthase subunit B [Erysipelotrichaceae bacterium]|nr:F0F1 ATP synthase subunit B [Erysipelotrichaceae bacterium]